MPLKGKARSIARGLTAAAAGAFMVLVYMWLTLPDVRELATENPTSTAFMRLRAREAEDEGRTLRHVHQWVPYSRISPNLKRAVLVAEDSAFWDHEGLDLEELRKSIQINIEQGAAVRGASTITQQLAKNLYLSPSRDPLRKLKELIIARRMEAALPKARIFEIYLNVIEWGDGVWGAEAAARTYFGTSAAGLGRQQAALLAGAIVNPRVLSPARPNRRLLRRQAIILARMGNVQPPAASEIDRPAPAPVPLPPSVSEEDEAAMPDELVPPSTDELPSQPPPPPPPEAAVPSPEPFPTPQ